MRFKRACEGLLAACSKFATCRYDAVRLHTSSDPMVACCCSVEGAVGSRRQQASPVNDLPLWFTPHACGDELAAQPNRHAKVEHALPRGFPFVPWPPGSDASSMPGALACVSNLSRGWDQRCNSLDISSQRIRGYNIILSGAATIRVLNSLSLIKQFR